LHLFHITLYAGLAALSNSRAWRKLVSVRASPLSIRATSWIRSCPVSGATRTVVRPARTPTNIRLYSENDVRRILWIRHLTQNLGVNLAGVRVLFMLEERLGMRILEQLYSEPPAAVQGDGEATAEPARSSRAGQRRA